MYKKRLVEDRLGEISLKNISKNIFETFSKINIRRNIKKNKLLHFEWSPPWHHIDTYLSQILTFFVLKSGEDEKERIILMKSRAFGLWPLDFIRIILSSSFLFLIRDPAVTTVIYLAKLIQTDSRYSWFQKKYQTPGRLKTPRHLQTPGRLQTPRRLPSSSLLLVRGPAVTTVIYQAKLIQTDSRYAWFKTISDARASRDA